MCEIKQKIKSVGKKGRFDLDLTCKKSGLPITVTNANGMFCAKMCDEDQDIAARKIGEKFVKGIMKDMFGKGK